MEVEKFTILFADNNPDRHIIFKDDVVTPLIQQYRKNAEKIDANPYNLEFYYSQSLEARYPNMKGAKSVEEWVREGMRFDIVVTDMNFSEKGMSSMGGIHTGLDIIEYIKEKGSHHWTQYLLITAYREQAPPQRLMSLVERKILGSDSFIELSARKHIERDWIEMRGLVRTLIRAVSEQREQERQVMEGLLAPALYEVTIFYKYPVVEYPIGVIVAEGVHGPKIGFILTTRKLPFWVLAGSYEDEPRKYKKQGEITEEVNKLLKIESRAHISPFYRSLILRNASIEVDVRRDVNTMGWKKLKIKNESPSCNLLDVRDLCPVAQRPSKEVPEGSRGYKCKTNLKSLCVKTLTERTGITVKKFKPYNIGDHFHTIRHEISKANMFLKEDRPSANLRYHHDDYREKHKEKTFCGHCLIYRRENKPGYALAANVHKEPLEDIDNLEDKMLECEVEPILSFKGASRRKIPS